jgi:hypothetical protein
VVMMLVHHVMNYSEKSGPFMHACVNTRIISAFSDRLIALRCHRWVDFALRCRVLQCAAMCSVWSWKFGTVILANAVQNSRINRANRANRFRSDHLVRRKKRVVAVPILKAGHAATVPSEEPLLAASALAAGAPAALESASAGPKATSSGGGGRWVHVPN